MDSNLLLATYKTPLILQRDKASLRGGICLSIESFDTLKTTRHAFLHPTEITYFDNLPYVKRQYSYLLGRYCAKQAMGIILTKNNVTSICIENGVFQQPIVSSLQRNNIQVSISHTNTLGAAIAFPEAHPMAIDVETICSDKATILKTQLTADEQKLSNFDITQLTLLWTAKEALSKVLKCGFMVPFELLEISKCISSGHVTFSEFKNFSQYQALSFLIMDSVCSLVYPKKTQLSLDTNAIYQLFRKSK